MILHESETDSFNVFFEKSFSSLAVCLFGTFFYSSFWLSDYFILSSIQNEIVLPGEKGSIKFTVSIIASFYKNAFWLHSGIKVCLITGLNTNGVVFPHLPVPHTLGPAAFHQLQSSLWRRAGFAPVSVWKWTI